MERLGRVENIGETRRSYPREAQRQIGRRALRAERYGRGSEEREGRGEAAEVDEQTRLTWGDRALMQFDDSGIKMSDFVGIYGAKKVMRDQEWVLGLAQEMAKSRKSPEAAQFEDIFIQGVNIGNWLGNLTTARHGGPEFDAFAMKAALLDDLSGKTDDVVELKFAEPIEGEDGSSIASVKLAFDVTTTPQRKAIRDKLTKSCNSGRVDLPFGFTHLEYYENGDERGPVARLPRYTIGLSKYDIRDIWERSSVDTRYGGKIRQMPPSPQTQFKVLTEIRAQNELFYAMLPEDADEALRLELEATDECLQGALTSCAQLMVKRGMLPRAVRDKIEAEHKRLAAAGARNVTTRDRGIIEEYLLESSHAYFQVSEQERARRTGEKPEADQDDPFVQIVTEARRLVTMAQKGELDEYRKPMPRNKGF